MVMVNVKNKARFKIRVRIEAMVRITFSDCLHSDLLEPSCKF